MRRIFHSFLSQVRHLKLSTPISVILGALIIGASILGYGFITRDGSSSAKMTQFAGKAIDSSDIAEGNAKSKVVVVEYSDPECPYCVTVYPTMKQLRNEYKDKVNFVYRHYPLTQIHPHAFDESKAIACAQTIGGSGKANEYIDAIYGYKSSKQTTQLIATGKEDLARNIGLDIVAFTTCMNDQKTTETINASMADGVAAGVQGTPTSFVLVKTRKGYEQVALIDGARPYTYFKAALDQALAQ